MHIYLCYLYVVNSDSIREYARRNYIEPARRRGDSRVQIVAGDVEKAVNLRNRTPLVCQALRSRKFLEENHLVIEKEEGPPSGLGTRMKFSYRLTEVTHAGQSPFLRLRGVAKDVFQSLGGGEAFLRGERAAWTSKEDS
jgi:hypothetical protein